MRKASKSRMTLLDYKKRNAPCAARPAAGLACSRKKRRMRFGIPGMRAGLNKPCAGIFKPARPLRNAPPMRLRQSLRRGFFKACAQQSAAEKGANHAAIQAVEKSPPFRGAERFGNNLTPVRPPSNMKGCAKIPAFQPKATVFLRKHTPLKNRLRPDSYRPFLNESLT